MKMIKIILQKMGKVVVIEVRLKIRAKLNKILEKII